MKRFPHSKGRTVIAIEPSRGSAGLWGPDHLPWLDVPAHCCWLFYPGPSFPAQPFLKTLLT